jgi:hypothetical protein
MSHNERCKECKVRVQELLEKIYGRVITNYRIPVCTKPEDFREHPRYPVLNEIYASLQNHRGFTEFVRASYVDVDFFLPEQGLIVEFDESQHFTESRKIALAHYPSDIGIGFSRETWMKHCDEIKAHDNDPPFRDEQRAWYDTMRDFIPEIKGFQPTVRLYSRDMEWCKLDPEKPRDIEMFKMLLQNTPAGPKNWLATVTIESNVYKYPDNDAGKNTQKNTDRLAALNRITRSLAKQYSGSGIILFPGGYFHSGTGEVDQYITPIVEQIRHSLQEIYATNASDIIICLGVDGKVLLEEGPKNRYDTNQVAIAISKDRLIAYGKKFHPTDKIEAEIVDLASDYLSKENIGTLQYSRIFRMGGKSFYLAVCNDITGLKTYPKPESVDSVLSLIHGCYNRNDGPTCGYFVRQNLAGVSRIWKCPVFGAVVFFKRKIAEKWRTGIFYRKWEKDPIQCKTDENALQPILIDSSYLLEEGLAQVDVYDLDAVFGGRPVYRQQQKVYSVSSIETPINLVNVKAQSSTESSNLYQQLRLKLDTLFGKLVVDQKTKFSYRTENKIGYPNRKELDMISLFKPTTHTTNKVRFLIYPHILKSHLGLQNTDEIINALPEGSVLKQSRKNPHNGDIYIAGFFSNEGEIKKFVNWIVPGRTNDLPGAN